MNLKKLIVRFLQVNGADVSIKNSNKKLIELVLSFWGVQTAPQKLQLERLYVSLNFEIYQIKILGVLVVLYINRITGRQFILDGCLYKQLIKKQSKQFAHKYHKLKKCQN